MNKEELKENWLKIVDLIANAKGIVDLVDAEQIFLKALAQQKQEIKEIIIKMQTHEAEAGFGAEDSLVGYDQALEDIIKAINKL